MEFQSSIYALSTGWIASGEGPGLYCRSCWCIKFLVWLSEWGIAINCWISRICLHSHNHCTRILVRSFSSLQEQMYLVPTRHRGQVFSYHKHIPTFWNWFVEINFYIKKKITAFQTLYWSNIHVFLCLFILKTSFKNYSFLLLFLRDPLEHMRHFVWQF